MNVIFRADSSSKIGTGHVMRCLTLANNLKRSGAKISFICKDLTGNINHLIHEQGHRLHLLSDIGNLEADVNETVKILLKEASIDWLVVDHYGLDQDWESEIRPYVKRIMVIDDLANRNHDCDLLLDQNLYKNSYTRYEGLVPKHCVQLLGQKFVLLRDEFIKERRKLRVRDGRIQRILIFFGGSDSTNETNKVLDTIFKMDLKNIIFDVVVGDSNLKKDHIKNICEQSSNLFYYCQTDRMAELINRADLAIGAGGATTWERCYLGLPSIVIIVADNQIEATNVLEEEQVIYNLGYYTDVTTEEIEFSIKRFIQNRSLVQKMSKRALQLMNGESYDQLPVTKFLYQEERS